MLVEPDRALERVVDHEGVRVQLSEVGDNMTA